MRRTALLLVFLCACKPADDAAGSGTAANEPVEAAKPVASTSPTGEVATKSETPSPKSGKSEPSKLDPGKARELRKQYRTLLEEGRTLTKADKLAEAMLKYDAALAIDPSDPIVLGELGWAQFKANKLEDAQTTTMHALRFAQDDSTRGMLLYNLGRIAEARTENEAAITYYRTSLEKRPGNATVQEHLDTLLGGAPLAAAPIGLERLAEGVADIEAACKVILDKRCEEYSGTTDPDAPFNRCECSGELHTGPPDDDSWGLLTLTIDEDRQEVEFPVVKTSSGWVVFSEIEWCFNPGVSGVFEEVHLQSTKLEALLPGAAEPQLVLSWKKYRSDSDMGVNEIESEDHEGMVVCAREGAQAWCTKPLIWRDSYVRDVEYPAEDEDPPIEHGPLPISKQYTATFEWRDGQLIVSNVKRDGDPGEHREAGEYPLTELLGR